MTKERAAYLADVLKDRFGGQVEYEQVTDDGRFRFAVISEGFKDVPHLDRQDAIWKVVDSVLNRGETLGITVILAFDPADMSMSD